MVYADVVPIVHNNRPALHQYLPPLEALQKDSRPKNFLWLASLQVIAVKMGYPWLPPNCMVDNHWSCFIYCKRIAIWDHFWAPVDFLEPTHITSRDDLHNVHDLIAVEITALKQVKMKTINKLFPWHGFVWKWGSHNPMEDHQVVYVLTLAETAISVAGWS